MTVVEYLDLLGLNKKQIGIYMDLAANPDSSVVEMHARTSYPRSSIYLELERLMRDGLVISRRVEKTRRFSITNPKNLKYLIEEDKMRVNRLSSSFSDFYTKVEGLANLNKFTNSIHIYRKSSGIKQLLWNILSCRSGEVVGYSPGTLEDVIDRDFAEKWRREFRNRGLTNRIILNSNVSLDWSDVKDFLSENVEARTLEEKQIKFDREILLYDDTMVVISKKTDPNQYGVEITDKLLVSSHWQLFDFLWKEVAKKVG